MAAPAEIAEFIALCRALTLTEGSGSQSVFNKLCRLLDIDPPLEANPQGEWFTFEKGVTKTGGGKGWADVWYKNRFA